MSVSLGSNLKSILSLTWVDMKLATLLGIWTLDSSLSKIVEHLDFKMRRKVQNKGDITASIII